MSARLCAACKEDGAATVATWHVTGQRPIHASQAHREWNEGACHAHRDDALRFLPATWGLKARNMATGEEVTQEMIGWTGPSPDSR